MRHDATVGCWTQALFVTPILATWNSCLPMLSAREAGGDGLLRPPATIETDVRDANTSVTALPIVNGNVRRAGERAARAEADRRAMS